MSHSWGRTDAAGTWPHPKPVWMIAALLIATVSGAALGTYQYAAVWTPLQRLYLPSYVRSEFMGGLGFTTNGRYHLLQVVGRAGSRLALDDEVRSVRTTTGEPSFALTEAAAIIHTLMQTAGQVSDREHGVRVLVARQEITGADRQWAEQYEPGDVVRYTTGSKALAIKAGEYVRVDQVEAHDNRLTVTRHNGERVTYDPRRLQGMTLYREADRAFATGDRVQFTAPYRERHVANRELGIL